MAIADKFSPDTNLSGAADGFPQPYLEMAADGACTIAHGTVFITKAGVCAITLDTPPVNMNGAVLRFVSSTAQAHTVTHTPGFGGGTTARDVATWGGAINDGMVLLAYAGVWYVSSTRNVTIA